MFKKKNARADLMIAGVQAPDREVYLSLKHGVEAKSYDEVCITEVSISFSGWRLSHFLIFQWPTTLWELPQISCLPTATNHVDYILPQMNSSLQAPQEPDQMTLTSNPARMSL